MERRKEGQDATPLKLLLMGDSGTGKSSLLLRFTEDRFMGEDVHTATIGVDFKVKLLTLGDMQPPQKVKLTIWDTAGQERFRTLTSSYYRGTQGVILVYDVTSRASFDHLRQVWLRELQTYTKLEEMVIMLVGNKVDKTESRQVAREEGIELAKELKALFMECSAKTKVGVQAAFSDLVGKIMRSPAVLAAASAAHGATTGAERLRQLRQTTEEQSTCSC